jgi:ABC-type Na+ transport system ATPase subunit NatA
VYGLIKIITKENEVEQNITIRNKINEANHDYQVMRAKAKRRIKRKATLFDIERRAEERAIRKSLGVESYFGDERREVIFWGVVTAGFWAFTAYLVWISV